MDDHNPISSLPSASPARFRRLFGARLSAFRRARGMRVVLQGQGAGSRGSWGPLWRAVLIPALVLPPLAQLLPG